VKRLRSGRRPTEWFFSLSLCAPLVLLLLFGEWSIAETEFKVPEKKFLIKPYIEIPGLLLELKSNFNKDKSVIWAPNYRAQTGLSLAYNGWIGVSAAGKGDLRQEDQALKGDTSYTDFRFRFPWRRISFEFGYQRTRGFFAENTSAFDSSANGTYLKRPDLQLESKYLQMIAVLKPDRYSLAAAFDQSEQHVSDGGSLLAVLQFIETGFSDSQAIIPVPLQASFGSEALVNRGLFRTVNMGIGYGHLFRFRETVYAFGQILAGVGAQMGKSYSDTQEFSANESSFLLKADLGFGTNGEDWVSGILFSIDSNSNKTSATELSRRLTLLQIFVGYRL